MSEAESEARFDFPEDADDAGEQEHLGATLDVEGKGEEALAGGTPLAGVPLFPGTDLSAEQAGAVMAGSLCRLVVVAGMPKSGKTTLMATLYELFQSGPFAGYHFAGSRTQLGFDERCHTGRTASRREEEEMERTLPGEVGYLHLALRSQRGKEPTRHLLFTDISGETFRDEVRNSASGTRALEVLRRADHFVLLIDAAELANPARRHKAIADARMVLESCTQEGMVGHHTHVQVAYARWDLAPPPDSIEGGRLLKFLNGVVEPRLKHFEKLTASLSIGQLAARPTRGNLKLGHGVSELLQGWTERSALLRRPEPQEPRIEFGDREIVRFRRRVMELI